MIWGMFMIVPMESAVFMGITWTIVNPSKTQKISHPDKMFDISTRLVSEQDEISGLETIGWENHSWKYLSLIGDERVMNLQRTKLYVFFSESVLCLGKIHKNQQSNTAWEERLCGSNHLLNTETLTETTASQWNSSGISSQYSIRCSSVKKSNVYCWD